MTSKAEKKRSSDSVASKNYDNYARPESNFSSEKLNQNLDKQFELQRKKNSKTVIINNREFDSINSASLWCNMSEATLGKHVKAFEKSGRGEMEFTVKIETEFVISKKVKKVIENKQT